MTSRIRTSRRQPSRAKASAAKSKGSKTASKAAKSLRPRPSAPAPSRTAKAGRKAKKDSSSRAKGKAAPTRSAAPKASLKPKAVKSTKPSRAPARQAATRSTRATAPTHPSLKAKARPGRRADKAASAPSATTRRGKVSAAQTAPEVDPRQLALPFAGRRGSKAAPAQAPKAVASTKPLKPKAPEPTAPLPTANSPVPFSMARLKERFEQEQERRKRAAERQDDSAPDSTLRALPVGVRRGRLTPRTERLEGNAPASSAHDLDALDRILSSAGIVRESEALRSYLLPWLNGSDVLGFVPADRAALAGCSAVALANRKKALLVLASEESVTDQVQMLRHSGLEVVTLPLNPEERALELGRLRKEPSFVLVVSLDRLFTEDVLDECRSLSFDLLAIDEAQRVSELAPDFDPGVERIADLAPRLGRPPTLALLRAVPPSVRSDLPHRLGLRNPLRVDLSPVHDSIALEVISSEPSKRTAQVTNMLRAAALPAMVLGYSMADVNDVLASLSGAGLDARRFDPVIRPSAQELTEPAIWVVPTGRVTNPIQFARTLVHFRSPPSLEQYCRDLGWVHYAGGNAKSVMFVASDDEAMVKGTLERQRPRAEDLVGIAGVLVRHGSNSSTVLLDSLCPAVGMNRTRVESLVSIFGRTGWVDHAQDWVRLRPDCPDLVERARGLGARLKTAKERDAQRLRSVSAYVVSRGCRQESLRRHFGTAGSRPCGLCDACVSGRNTQQQQAQPQPQTQATSGRSEEEGNSPVSRAITSDLDPNLRSPLSDKPAWVHRRRLILI